MTFTPSRVVEHQVALQPFTVSVSYISESGRGNITGTNLWSLRAFFSDSENGTNPSIETQVDLGSLSDAPFYSGQTLEFNDLTLDVPLKDLVCHMSTYFCTQLGKGDPNNTDYSLEIRPACQLIQCAGRVELFFQWLVWKGRTDTCSNSHVSIHVSVLPFQFFFQRLMWKERADTWILTCKLLHVSCIIH